MRKFLSGAILSATIIAGNAPLVLANPTNLKTGNSVTVNSVAPKSSLIEIEGRTLTDAEAAKVEGEAWWYVAIPVGGAVAGVGYNSWRNVRNGRPWHQNWAQSGVAGAYGSTCAGIAVASRGALYNAGSYWASCAQAGTYLYRRW